MGGPSGASGSLQGASRGMGASPVKPRANEPNTKMVTKNYLYGRKVHWYLYRLFFCVVQFATVSHLGLLQGQNGEKIWTYTAYNWHVLFVQMPEIVRTKAPAREQSAVLSRGLAHGSCLGRATWCCDQQERGPVAGGATRCAGGWRGERARVRCRSKERPNTYAKCAKR